MNEINNNNNTNNPFIPQVQNSVPAPGQQTPGMAPDQFFDIDLREVQSSFTIPDGEYTLRCIDVEQGVSRADNPQYIWTFVVVNGEYAGKEFKVFTALTPAAMWKVAETVEALGIGSVGQAVRFRRQDVIGRQCTGVIEKQTYNNQERSQITRLVKI